MDINRRRFVSGLGAVGLAGVAGCTGNGGDGGGGGGGDDVDANVGMVYATGGLGDGSFNDQAQTGIQQADEDFDINYDETQPEEVSDFGNLQQQFAQSTNPDYDLVSCIGFLQADALGENAQEYPEQSFQIVDSVVEADNVASYVFAEHEGSFLVGLMAGQLTGMEFEAGAGATQSDSTNVGFVGGVESDLIQKFEAGYIAGVKHASEDIDVQTSYVGDFNDPSGGKEAALSMFDSGADIVYHAAGNTGTGVFDAAQEEGRFAIGVDQDQSVTAESYADVILASMVKRVDTAVYTAVEETVNGEFEGGRTVPLGLEEDGVEAVYGQELEGDIPDEVKDEVASAREDIIAGDIDVPDSP